MAAALVPATDNRPALPARLRAWISSTNPATPAYLGASGVFTLLLAGNVANTIDNGNLWTFNQRLSVAILGTLAGLPWTAILGYHVNQARRLFRAGHTLADLRSALEVARRERAESDELSDRSETRMTRVLRNSFYGAGAWGGVTMVLGLMKVIHERVIGPWPFILPLVTTAALGVACNILEVPMMPDVIRRQIKPGLRDRLWRGRIGEWLAKRLKAPERSVVAGASAFRATEAALGVAASELFAALPKAYRERFAELPAIVEALEARAAGARAEADVVAALAPAGTVDADVLADRRRAAAAQLAQSVAALEAIRLDLLRLHAGASDLAPLTTLIDAARVAGEDVRRLAEAQEEVDGMTGRKRGAGRIETPV